MKYLKEKYQQLVTSVPFAVASFMHAYLQLFIVLKIYKIRVERSAMRKVNVFQKLVSGCPFDFIDFFTGNNSLVLSSKRQFQNTQGKSISRKVLQFNLGPNVNISKQHMQTSLYFIKFNSARLFFVVLFLISVQNCAVTNSAASLIQILTCKDPR